MAYFKNLEVDEEELEQLRAACVYSRELLAVISQGLAAIDSRLILAARWLNVMDFRVRNADEVDPYED